MSDIRAFAILTVLLLTGCARACDGENMLKCRAMCGINQVESYSPEAGCKCEVKP